MNRELIKKLFPFVITIVVVIIDQISKLMVTSSMHLGQTIEVLGDFFRLRFIRNPNVIFGLGGQLPDFLRPVLIVAAPILGMALLVVYYFKSKDLEFAYRLPLAGILGGGIGNVIDRLFQPGGVVDFFDVKFFGIFGWERFPTFNVADSAVTVSALFILGIYIFHEIRTRKQKKNEN